MIRSLLLRHIRHHARLLASLWGGLFLLELVLVWIVSRVETSFGFSMLEQIMPTELQEIISTQIGIFSFNGMIGFGFQHPVVLAGSIAFVTIAATIPAAERESGFLDLILARPVQRVRYFLAVLLLMILGAVILPLALLLGLALGTGSVESAGELPWTRYIPSATGLIMLLLAIGGYTLLFGVEARRRGSAAARAVGLTLVLFWLDLVANMWSVIQPLGYLSPFHYFEPIRAAVIPHTPVENPFVLLGIFVLGTLAALFRFQRQDL
jgi:ABC-2 type transport system permease protein